MESWTKVYRILLNARQALTVVILSLVASACCDASPTAHSRHVQNESLQIEQENVEAATLKYIFRKYGDPHLFKVYFVGMMPGDPSKSLLNRFLSNFPKVKRASQSRTNYLGVWDKKNGKKGVLFQVSKPTM